MGGCTMAKARDIPGLHADLSYREAAAATVAVRARELFDHAEGVLDTSDIERVHDMRVATRRLRAVLEIYEPCFPRKELRDVLGDVEALADALGERRDPDVHLAQLEEFAGAVKAADRPGVQLFAERVRSEQGAGNEALAGALAEIEHTDLRGRLAALSAAASPEHDPRRSFGLQRPGLQRPERL
jgi:CHAD domain-containing protein